MVRLLGNLGFINFIDAFQKALVSPLVVSKSNKGARVFNQAGTTEDSFIQNLWLDKQVDIDLHFIPTLALSFRGGAAGRL